MRDDDLPLQSTINATNKYNKISVLTFPVFGTERPGHPVPWLRAHGPCRKLPRICREPDGTEPRP